MTCNETQEDQDYKEISKQYKKFNVELGEFLEKPAKEIHPEALLMSLLCAVRCTACAYFGCYLHLLGFLTQNLTEDLSSVHKEIQEIVKKEREKKDESNTL